MCGMCPSSDSVLKETLISKIHLQTFAPFEGNSYLCPCAASNLDFMSLVSIHVSILSFRFKSCPKHGSRYCKECPVTETTFSRQKNTPSWMILDVHHRNRKWQMSLFTWESPFLCSSLNNSSLNCFTIIDSPAQVQSHV